MSELSDYLIEYYPVSGLSCHAIDMIGLKALLANMSINIRLESKGPDIDGKDITRLYLSCSDCNFEGLTKYSNIKSYKAEKEASDIIIDGQWLIDLGTYTSDRSAAKSSGLTFQLDAKLKKFGESGLVCSKDEGAMHQLLYASPTQSNPLDFKDLSYVRQRCKQAFIDDKITPYRLIQN